LGLLVFGGSAAALKWLAFDQLDLVFLVVGYGGIGLCAVSGIFVCLAAAWLKLRTSSSVPTRLLLETQVPSKTGFSLPSIRFIPFIRVHWQWEQPAGPDVDVEQGGKRLLEVVMMHERGRFRHIYRRVFVEDSFGLSRIAIHLDDSQSIDVLPHLGGLRHAPMLISMAGGDELPHPMGIDRGDRMELQRYVPGDPARFIHWKVFGRTRKLMIRVPERALTQSHRTAAFLIAGQDDDATAAVTRMVLERQLLGNDWVFGSDLAIAGTSDLEEALTEVMRSVEARDRSGHGLSPFLEEVEKQGPASLIIFAPPVAGEWIGQVLSIARFRKVHIVIGLDGIGSERKRSLWERIVHLPETQTSISQSQLNLLISKLKHSNCHVTVLDRFSGRSLSDAHLRALNRVFPGQRGDPLLRIMQ